MNNKNKTMNDKKTVADYFLFASYLNGWYEYYDNTKEGNIYINVVTHKTMTEQQIFDEWILKNKSK